jgi:hypothetical protein
MTFTATGPMSMTVEIPSAYVSAEIGSPVTSSIDGTQFKFLITGGRITLAGNPYCSFYIN